MGTTRNDLTGSSNPFSLDDRPFRALLDIAPVAVSVTRKGVILYGNPAYRSMFGYAPDAVIAGRSVLEHYSPSARLDIQKRIHDLEGGYGGDDRSDTRGLRLDGCEFDLNITLIKLPLTDGDATLAFMTDVSDRHRMEESLEEHQARFKVVFSNAGIGMALLAMNGMPILVNPAMERFLGYRAEEMVSMTFAQFTHPGDVAKDAALFKEIVVGKREGYRLENRYVRKDASIVRGSLTVTVVPGPRGKPKYVVCMVEDITASKAPEKPS